MKEKKINDFVYLKNSNIHNKGIFALKKIPKDTRIIEYTGKLVSKTEGLKRSILTQEKHKKNPKKGAVYLFEIDKKTDLDGDTKTNYAKFINHSCEPNSEYEQEEKRIFVKTIKSVNKNEEIKVNYGFSWSKEDYTEHPCECGSKKCVGYILDKKDWPKLRKHLNKKYPNTKLSEIKKHEYFLGEAIKEAKKSLRKGGIPIGSVLVLNDKIIGRGHNKRIQKNSPILHAEIDCLNNAGRLNTKDYKKCVIYSTLSPCEMCSGAIQLYKIPLVVIGENTNYEGSKNSLTRKGIKVINIDSKECKKLLNDFIQENLFLWLEDIGE